MFKTKPGSSNVMTTPTPSKIDNVPVTVLVDITIHKKNSYNNRCLKKASRLKPKELKIGNKKSIFVIHLMKL
jgi:hypothetical protein